MSNKPYHIRDTNIDKANASYANGASPNASYVNAAPSNANLFVFAKKSLTQNNFILNDFILKNQTLHRFKIRSLPPLSTIASIAILTVIILGCLGCRLFIPKDPTYMDLAHYSMAPGNDFWFGTDTMGRDIFSMIWYGGRVSLGIGFAATTLSTAIAILFGSVSGLAPRWLDALLMRLTEILISIPNLLLVIFVQAIWGDANVWNLSIVIGITSWFGIAKVIRTEVRQIRNSEYVIAAKCMGGSFFHILWKHLTPNFISSIMFMIIMNIRNAIAAESTLSFMGIGLPLEIISWGSMLSLSERSLLNGAWWIIFIPGVFLILTLACITNIGNYLRKRSNDG